MLIGQVNVNVADKDGHTPLEEALFEAKDLEMASELVKNKANVNSKDSNGKLSFFKLENYCKKILSGYF